MDIAYIKTPIGVIEIVGDGESITKLDLFEDKTYFENKNLPQYILNCKKQLLQYFSGKRKTFDLKLKPKGTEFQLKVWNELLKIPYGETVSYSDIAKNIGKPKASRAVGNAVNKNPIFIIIPCHRVIGKSGSLVGFAYGLDKKEYLLNLEK